jgi:hypothetical protein
MAIGLITRFPEGMGAAEYDAVDAKLDQVSNPPDGLIMHCCGELDGQFQVFDLWESREKHDAFRDGRLKDAMVAVMGEETYNGLPEAERVQTEIHNYVIP